MSGRARSRQGQSPTFPPHEALDPGSGLLTKSPIPSVCQISCSPSEVSLNPAPPSNGLTPSNTGVGNFKSRELHCLSSEPELLWVQGDPVSSTYVEPLLGLVEAFLDGRGPQERVVNALRLSLNQCHNFIITPGVAVPRSLGCCIVAVTAPWRYEGVCLQGGGRRNGIHSMHQRRSCGCWRGWSEPDGRVIGCGGSLWSHVC